jgi:hypothetical protein
MQQPRININEWRRATGTERFMVLKSHDARFEAGLSYYGSDNTYMLVEERSGDMKKEYINWVPLRCIHKPKLCGYTSTIPMPEEEENEPIYCICGKANLRKKFFVGHKDNGIGLLVGSCCIKKFIKDGLKNRCDVCNKIYKCNKYPTCRECRIARDVAIIRDTFNIHTVYVYTSRIYNVDISVLTCQRTYKMTNKISNIEIMSISKTYNPQPSYMSYFFTPDREMASMGTVVTSSEVRERDMERLKEDRSGEYRLYWGIYKGNKLSDIPSYYLNHILDAYEEPFNKIQIERYLLRNGLRHTWK